MTEEILGDGNPDGTTYNGDFIRGIAGKRRAGVLATPGTSTGTVTLTVAQMLGGVLVATPAAVATYTTPTATLLEAAIVAAGATADNDDTFDLCIVNLGGAGDIITMAGGTGVTFVGSLTVDDAGADINSSGTFRFRRTSATSYVGYRVA